MVREEQIMSTWLGSAFLYRRGAWLKRVFVRGDDTRQEVPFHPNRQSQK